MTALRNTRTFTIPQARQADEQRLREIAFAAKAGWGYDRQRVARWADTLRLCDQATAAAETFVYETNGKPVAWMRLIPREHICILEDLWVEPALHRHGIGSSLFRHAQERAHALGAQQLEWEAEPYAIAFYERMGGKHITNAAPNEWGRVLPIMAIAVP